MDDDITRSEDLAAAWPEDNDLESEGQEETQTSKESYSEETLIEPEVLTSAPEDTMLGGGDQPSEEEQKVEDLPGSGSNSGETVAADEHSPSGPVSWSATARETWKDIPKEAQDYILQREQQMQQGMQKNAEMARRASGMDKSLAPYQQYFSVNGGAGKTLQTLLQTGAGLQMGTPQQKAQLVADIIQQYGVDIPALDSLITGKEVPAEMQQQSQMEQMLQQRLAPMQQQLAQYQQREHETRQGIQREAGGEVSVFSQDPKNEFYTDVRGEMADILDMAANRGVQLSLKQAYDKACALNPEISRIQQSREQQKTLASKRRAAVSVTGGMGGPGATAAPESMRNAIESAWDNAGQI